jgi:type IV secretory pathway VirB2 component (pilin)
MKFLKIIGINIIVATILFLPVFIYAELPNPSTPTTPSTSGLGAGSIKNPFNCGGTGGDCNFITLLTVILNKIVMPIASIAAVVYIIYAGFTYVTAQGNDKKIGEAHQRLLWALIGTGILLGAAAISQVVQNTVKMFTN